MAPDRKTINRDWRRTRCRPKEGDNGLPGALRLRSAGHFEEEPFGRGQQCRDGVNNGWKDPWRLDIKQLRREGYIKSREVPGDLRVAAKEPKEGREKTIPVLRWTLKWGASAIGVT